MGKRPRATTMPWSRSLDFLETFSLGPHGLPSLKASALHGHDLSYPGLIHHSGALPQDHGDFLFGVSKPRSEFLVGSAKLPIAVASVGVGAIAPNIIDSGMAPRGTQGSEHEDGEEREELENEKATCVSRGLMLMLASDILLAAVIKWNWRLPCDMPLLQWLGGCLALGFPASALSYGLVEGRSVYKYYRLTPQSGLSLGDISGVQFNGLDTEIDLAITNQHEGEHITAIGPTPHWLVSMADQVAVCRYRLQVGRGDRPLPPNGWILEASNNRVNWEVLHEVDSKNAWCLFQNLSQTMPGIWETDDLTGLGQDAFHRAFKVELLATAAAFVWLATGTHWVGMAETCIDTAPGLWWTSFLSVVSAWSVLGTGSMSLILRSIMVVLPKS